MRERRTSCVAFFPPESIEDGSSDWFVLRRRCCRHTLLVGGRQARGRGRRRSSGAGGGRSPYPHPGSLDPSTPICSTPPPSHASRGAPDERAQRLESP